MSSKKITILLLLLLASLALIAQQDILVHLQVNNKEKATVYHDQPLIISVSISNPKASEDEQWNREADRGLTEIEEMRSKGKLSEEKYKEEKQQLEKAKKNIPAIVIGSDTQPAYQLIQFKWKDAYGGSIDNIGMKFLDSSLAPDQFILDANAYFTFRWGIDKSTMRKLEAGKYFLTVTIGSYDSKEVELVIRPLSIPQSTLSTVSMQSELGRFALLDGFADTAILHAKNILEVNPSSIDGLVLLGEANVQKKNYTEALKNFESALENFYKQNPKSSESPEYILMMIQSLKKKGL